MRSKSLRLWGFVMGAASVAAMAAPAWAQDAGGEAPLVPIPPRETDIASAIWVLISFVILLVILKKAAWNTVLESLKGREERIRANIQEAEEARAKAEAMLKEHAARIAGAEDQVRQLLAKATVDAEKIAANIRAQTQAESEAEREKTRKEIDSARRDAIRQVYEQTADLATEVASKILGRSLNAQDQQDLVQQTIGQFESMAKK
jgi:F-type H+-transporting ATPase subunit b